MAVQIGKRMPNAEVEGKEVLKHNPNNPPVAIGRGHMKRIASDMSVAQGPTHANGGVPVQAQPGTMVASDRIQNPNTNQNESIASKIEELGKIKGQLEQALQKDPNNAALKQKLSEIEAAINKLLQQQEQMKANGEAPQNGDQQDQSQQQDQTQQGGQPPMGSPVQDSSDPNIQTQGNPPQIQNGQLMPAYSPQNQQMQGQGAVNNIPEQGDGQAANGQAPGQFNSAEEEEPKFAHGGSMINPAHKGRFTEYKKRTGMSTQEALHSKNAHVRSMAQFAVNAKHFKHAYGGDIGDHRTIGKNYIDDNQQAVTIPMYPEGGFIPIGDMSDQFYRNRQLGMYPGRHEGNNPYYFSDDNIGNHTHGYAEGGTINFFDDDRFYHDKNYIDYERLHRPSYANGYALSERTIGPRGGSYAYGGRMREPGFFGDRSSKLNTYARGGKTKLWNDPNYTTPDYLKDVMGDWDSQKKDIGDEPYNYVETNPIFRMQSRGIADIPYQNRSTEVTPIDPGNILIAKDYKESNPTELTDIQKEFTQLKDDEQRQKLFGITGYATQGVTALADMISNSRQPDLPKPNHIIPNTIGYRNVDVTPYLNTLNQAGADYKKYLNETGNADKLPEISANIMDKINQYYGQVTAQNNQGMNQTDQFNAQTNNQVAAQNSSIDSNAIQQQMAANQYRDAAIRSNKADLFGSVAGIGKTMSGDEQQKLRMFMYQKLLNGNLDSNTRSIIERALGLTGDQYKAQSQLETKSQ